MNKQLNNEGTKQLENKRTQVRNKTSKHVAGVFGRIGKWNKPIKNAKTLNNLNIINKNINKRVELKGKIEASNIPSKRELLNKVKKFNLNVNDLNKIFKKELNNSEFNAGAELNKQLNNEGNRQLKNKKNALTKKTKNVIANPFRRIGKWQPAITNAKTMKEVNNIEKNLNNRVKLRNDIKKSTLTPKEQREYTNMVMKQNKNVKNTRNLFEKGVNKGISNTTGPLVKGILNKAVANNKGSFNGGLRLGNNNNNIIKGKPVYENSNSNNNNNKSKMRFGGRAAEQKMQPNPTFEPNMKNNPLFNNNGKGINSENVKLEPKPPNAPKPNKLSFRGLVQKNKEKRVMNAVKLAGKKVALSQATGPERIKMARNLAPKTQNNVNKLSGFGKLLKKNNKNAIRKAAEGAAEAAKGKIARNARPRSERRVDNKERLKELKKVVKKKNPRLSPAGS